MYPKLVVVQSDGARTEAELAKTALTPPAFGAMIQADSVGGMREPMAWSAEGFQVLVREDDATEARDVLTPPAGAPTNEADETPNADGSAGRPWHRFT